MASKRSFRGVSDTTAGVGRPAGARGTTRRSDRSTFERAVSAGSTASSRNEQPVDLGPGEAGIEEGAHRIRVVDRPLSEVVDPGRDLRSCGPVPMLWGVGWRQRIGAGWDVLVELGRNITRHHTMLIAGGVAFSCVLGLVPALIAIVAVYGLVASPADVESNLEPLIEVLPAEASDLLIEQLENVTAVSDTNITIGLAIGLIGVAWAISNVLNSMVMGIRIAHEMPSPHTWIKGRLFALKLGLVAVLATATMIWFVVALPRVLDRAEPGRALRWVITIARWPLVVLVSATALALLYRIVVGHRTGRFHAISTGAVIGTAMWVLSTYGLSLAYDHIGQLESTFGSLGAVAVLMVWLYLSVLSALVGAEVDGLAHRGTHSATTTEPDTPG